MLVNVPLEDQLMSLTNDNLPSNNAGADCAAASLLAAMKALGKASADKTPDWVKDGGYGEAYTGATDPEHYVAWAATQGVRISQVSSGDGTALVATIRQQLAQHLPVLGAIPSLWGNSFTGVDMVHFTAGTHEVCFCDDDGATLTAMNPWPFTWTGNNAWYQKQPYAWWAQRLVYGRVNPVSALSGGSPVANDSNLGPGFKAYADSHNLSAPQVPGGEHPNEPNPGEAWAAWDAFPVLTYTVAEGVRDTQPGRIVKMLLAQRDAARSALATTGANLASAEAALSQAQSQAQAAQAAAAALQAQVSTLQAQLAAAQASAPTPAESDAAAAVVALAKALKDVPA